MIESIYKFVSKTKINNIPKKKITYFATSYKNKLNESYKISNKQYEKNILYKNRLEYKNFVKFIEPITSYRDKRNYKS